MRIRRLPPKVRRPPRRRAWRGASERGTITAAVTLVACTAASDGSDQGVEAPVSCDIVQHATPLADGLDESSGVTVSRANPGVVWTHEDSGNDPVLFALDSSGRLMGRVQVSSAENSDWEDIAIGACPAGECLYIADIGDNEAKRNDVELYMVPEPGREAAATEPAERISLRYPQGPRDAEALFVLPPNDVYLITKGRNSRVSVYRVPSLDSDEDVVELERVRDLSADRVELGEQVTGADATPDGRWVAVRTYASLLLFRTEDLLAEGGTPALSVDLGPLGEGQGEGVAILDNGAVVLTSEGGQQSLPATMSFLRCNLPDAGGG